MSLARAFPKQISDPLAVRTLPGAQSDRDANGTSTVFGPPRREIQLLDSRRFFARFFIFKKRIEIQDVQEVPRGRKSGAQLSHLSIHPSPTFRQQNFPPSFSHASQLSRKLLRNEIVLCAKLHPTFLHHFYSRESTPL